MNRADRRNLAKQGVSEDTIDKMELLSKPCTIGEVIQISRAAAEDVCSEVLSKYRRDTSGLIMAMTVQLEVIKDILVNQGIISREEFEDLYRISAENLNEKQKQYIRELQKSEECEEAEETPADSLGTTMKVSDIEIVNK